jgi:hypothetical protein
MFHLLTDFISVDATDQGLYKNPGSLHGDSLIFGSLGWADGHRRGGF